MRPSIEFTQYENRNIIKHENNKEFKKNESTNTKYKYRTEISEIQTYYDVHYKNLQKQDIAKTLL